VTLKGIEQKYVSL